MPASATFGSPVVIQYEYGRSDSLPSPQCRSTTCVARAMTSRVIASAMRSDSVPSALPGNTRLRFLPSAGE